MLRRTLALLIALAGVASAAEAPIPPSPTRWVTDTAGAMTPAARAALDARLEGYQQTTGHQVVVWIGKTIQQSALDDWAVHTFASWKVGRKGLDDGIAMFVLMDDRKIDIEVGYGLEPVVTDAAASRVIREVMAPRLQKGDADGAITAGVDALVTAIGEGAAAPGSGPQPHKQPELPLGQKILFAILGLIALAFLITHPRAAMFLLSSMMSGRGGGGGGGGGGGFSGGGGRSGGGGARGGW